MATELAKAYVQIIPSARGIKDNLNKVLDSEMPSGESHGEKLGSGIASGIKKTLAAAGIGKIIKSSFSEGAALQQSVGGVETLFKGSADKVVKNAKSAYKTAGLSANEYMETVTGFSATLLQGLGGDTEKAAKIADRAITDMSDNSNKFGTAMQSVMAAYQGFAKQNFTLLDNLKLGYGGTQAEMARLINDSGVLGDAVQVTAETVKDVPFDKIIEAIGIIQDRLGVTGTTAKEAASTFSGSMSSMKAAAKNLLGALSTGEGVKEATENFTETAKTFLKDNFLPMLSTILRSAGTLIAEAVRNLPQLIVDVIKGLSFEDGATLAATAFGLFFLKKLKNYFSSGAGEHWSGIQSTLTQKFDAQGNPIGLSLGDKICAGLQAAVIGWNIGTMIYNAAKPGIDKITDALVEASHADEYVAGVDSYIEAKGKERVAELKQKGAYWLTSADWDNDYRISRAAEILGKAKTYGVDVETVYAAYYELEGNVNLINQRLQRIGSKSPITSAINLPSSQWGKDLTDNLAGGILSGSSTVSAAVQSLAGGIKKNIGFSEPEEGPLSDFHTYAPDMMQLFAQGITSSRDLVIGELSSVMGDVKREITRPAEQTVSSESRRTIVLKLVDGANRLLAEGTVEDIDILQGAEVTFTERRLA